MTRRDACYFVGRRAGKLHPVRAAIAWEALARRLEALGDQDIPKFKDLLTAIRQSTIVACQLNAKDSGWELRSPPGDRSTTTPQADPTPQEGKSH